METAKGRTITPEAYELLMMPPLVYSNALKLAIPTPRDIFEYQTEILIESRIFVPDQDFFDLMHALPAEGALFLAVPQKPPKLDGLDALIKKLVIGKNPGINMLLPHLISDDIKTPESHYFATNIDDGRRCISRKDADAQRILKIQERKGLTAWEAFLLILYFPQILNRHSVRAQGSEYGIDRKTPILQLVQERIEFCCYDEERKFKLSGSASCAGRVSLDS